LDIESRLVPERANFDERGLLGLAFHPDFGTPDAAGSGKFYVYYSAPDPAAPGTTEDPINHQSVIAEYQLSDADPNVADPNSERILMTFQQPQFNHNAGYLGFGPDGYLYITTGDGGSSNDNNAGHTGGDPSQPNGVLGNAQDRSNLLGKVLRIDVLGTDGPGGAYGVPVGNPFVGEPGVPGEIYAYGLRNPWRASFDNGPGGTGRFFVADVGQGDVEEVNILEAGGNYGWRIMEGSSEFDSSVSPDPVVPLIGPIAEYAHPDSEGDLLKVGLSVTGGVVYRGDDYPELQGKYLFGDWSNGFSQPDGTLLGLEETSPGNFDLSVLDVEGGNPIGEFIQAFGLDEAGEAYVATRRTLAPSALDPDTGLPTGSVYRISVVPEPTSGFLAICGLFLALIRLRLNPRRGA
jgi:glucose/arabinose dehydrogenase